MSVFREIRIGSAASAVIIGGCFAPAGSQALDLPARSAAPVESVPICTAHGTGFFNIAQREG